jgi:hypothetical protein
MARKLARLTEQDRKRKDERNRRRGRLDRAGRKKLREVLRGTTVKL